MTVPATRLGYALIFLHRDSSLAPAAEVLDAGQISAVRAPYSLLLCGGLYAGCTGELGGGVISRRRRYEVLGAAAVLGLPFFSLYEVRASRLANLQQSLGNLQQNLASLQQSRAGPVPWSRHARPPRAPVPRAAGAGVRGAGTARPPRHGLPRGRGRRLLHGVRRPPGRAGRQPVRARP
jgi:hypothetical protein